VVVCWKQAGTRSHPVSGLPKEGLRDRKPSRRRRKIKRIKEVKERDEENNVKKETKKQLGARSQMFSDLF
jgi:hypothetical protein